MNNLFIKLNQTKPCEVVIEIDKVTKMKLGISMNLYQYIKIIFVLNIFNILNLIIKLNQMIIFYFK